MSVSQAIVAVGSSRTYRTAYALLVAGHFRRRQLWESEVSLVLDPSATRSISKFHSIQSFQNVVETPATLSPSREANTRIGPQILTPFGVHLCRQSTDTIRQHVLDVKGKRDPNHNPTGRMPPNPTPPAKVNKRQETSAASCE